MKTEFAYRNEQTEAQTPYPISDIEVFHNTVKFTRIWGETPLPNYGPRPCYRTRTYENVSEASLQRLHNIVAELVKSQQADFWMGQVGNYGIMYEVQL